MRLEIEKFIEKDEGYMRRTKIICTIGPASCSEEVMRELLLAEATAACPAIVDIVIAYAGEGLTRVLVSVDRASFAQGADASSMKESLSAALNALGSNPRLIASADRVEIAPVLR